MSPNRVTTFDLPSLSRGFIGADSLFDAIDRTFNNSLNTAGNYPPYDIVKVDENNFAIEMAVAGFSEGDLNITLEHRVLQVVGDKEQEKKEDTRVYIHKGISSRSFKRSFTLGDDIVVKSAEVKNGMLSISLERLIPEEKKPKVIEVKYSK